jgi:tripartite-type tricarboxylate transporter receptor subunit TctC
MVRQLFVAGVLLLSAALAYAQEQYPSRALTMIVPYPPGGVVDLGGRPLAAAMEKVLKQPVVVSNRQGAAGAVGIAAAANAKPDGYTLLVTASSISVIPEGAMKVLREAVRKAVQEHRFQGSLDESQHTSHSRRLLVSLKRR